MPTSALLGTVVEDIIVSRRDEKIPILPKPAFERDEKDTPLCHPLPRKKEERMQEEQENNKMGKKIIDNVSTCIAGGMWGSIVGIYTEQSRKVFVEKIPLCRVI